MFEYFSGKVAAKTSDYTSFTFTLASGDSIWRGPYVDFVAVGNNTTGFDSRYKIHFYGMEN